MSRPCMGLLAALLKKAGSCSHLEAAHLQAASSHLQPGGWLSTARGACATTSLACSTLGQQQRAHSTASGTGADSTGDSEASKSKWQAVITRVHKAGGNVINPCNSRLHPAVVEGIIEPLGEEVAVQDAYTPGSVCFGCGPANPEGLQLKSKRIKNGLEAVVSVPHKYCAFPGIVNGGIVSALLDCHGNWTAAIALMDKACLPRPPLTLTASIYVSFKEPTPPGVPLLLRSQVVSMKDSSSPSVGKASVEVETHVYLQQESADAGTPGQLEPGLKLLAVGQGVHKRLGALRAL